MPPRDESQQETIQALQDLIAAFSGPHWVHPAYAEHVLAHAADLLDTASNGRISLRMRMPRQMWPRSAVFDLPDLPPTPPAAM
ncbi:hypothetical protein ASF48_07740 [Rathayibacter sp. Leaf299]|nr:hypothetical protein ASF48_07740 [Rathayibacter sp. Leaf299]